MHVKQVLLMTALGATLAVTEPAAAPVTTRMILHTSLGAWVSPVAVVLRSPEEWTLWNSSMVAAERAVAAEPVPPGIDWNREVVLVVAIGERSTFTTFELLPPRRSGHRLHFTGRIEASWTQSFSAPCHAVALDRRFADGIELDPGIGVLESAFPGVHATSARRGAIAAGDRSWGELKNAYR